MRVFDFRGSATARIPGQAESAYSTDFHVLALRNIGRRQSISAYVKGSCRVFIGAWLVFFSRRGAAFSVAGGAFLYAFRHEAAERAYEPQGYKLNPGEAVCLRAFALDLAIRDRGNNVEEFAHDSHILPFIEFVPGYEAKSVRGDILRLPGVAADLSCVGEIGNWLSFVDSINRAVALGLEALRGDGPQRAVTTAAGRIPLDIPAMLVRCFAEHTLEERISFSRGRHRRRHVRTATGGGDGDPIQCPELRIVTGASLCIAENGIRFVNGSRHCRIAPQVGMVT